jgi:RNA-directed DNA polymerase
MEGWTIAQSPILGTTITIVRLSERGYETLLFYYQEVAAHLKVWPYRRAARILV